MSNLLATKSVESLEVLSSASIKDFCDGYRWMFEKDLQSSLVSVETVSSSEFTSEDYGVLAVNQIAYAGENSGTGMFQIVLTKEALFSLGGVTVMLPVMRIREDCAGGKEEDAKMLADAVGEVGNLLTGSFGKVFRAGAEDEDGLGDQMTMHLRLPILLGHVKVPALEGVDKLHVLTYQIELNELNPFKLKIVFPAV